MKALICYHHTVSINVSSPRLRVWIQVLYGCEYHLVRYSPLLTDTHSRVCMYIYSLSHKFCTSDLARADPHACQLCLSTLYYMAGRCNTLTFYCADTPVSIPISVRIELHAVGMTMLHRKWLACGHSAAYDILRTLIHWKTCNCIQTKAITTEVLHVYSLKSH